MATPVRELGYGAVEVYGEELGFGSYGKVCKAKCGQLPCAAKLLHNSFFQHSDPGSRKVIERFEQECEFLSTIKHPNIVQYLGTSRDPQSERPILLMELMDESLTRFLERSTGPLPYHTQLNICHDVALALAYLHSNDIIHRDLSSNNVLLIGEGCRAKVTDFGMSKLESINPRMTPLTMCPGTQACMPPEALVNPPRYSNKLDCFSHGVLAIQIVTRQFPNPTDATTTVEDARYPTGVIHAPVPERKRRKKDIDLVDPNHPLLPLALHCLKDKDTERPSAVELCGRLTTLKSQPRYTSSFENSSPQALQREIETKASELERMSARLGECEEELIAKEETMEQIVRDCQAALRAKTAECERNQLKIAEHESVIGQLRKELQDQLQSSTTTYQSKTAQYESVMEKLRKELRAKQEQLDSKIAECKSNQSVIKQLQKELSNLSTRESPEQESRDLFKWRQGAQPPVKGITSHWGAAVVHRGSVYVSWHERVFAFSVSEDKWTELEPSRYRDFCMAVVRDQLTAIGGWSSENATNSILSLSESTSGTKWEELLPPMPTKLIRPAAVSNLDHLVVAGGRSCAVDILDLDSLQWSSASSSPKPFKYPHMTLCGEHLYLSEDNAVFSCSVEELLKSCKPASTTNSSDSDSVWTKLADIPFAAYYTSLTTLRGQVLAIGGRDQPYYYSGTPTEAIHRYNRSTNSWSVIGQMPTLCGNTLVAVLPSNELIVVGGQDGAGWPCNTTEIASTDQ